MMGKTKRILLALFIGVYVIFCYIFGCPIMTISGLPCPTCGVTHALISILKLDFDAYMKYNPMAIPLVLAVLLAIYFEKFKHKRIIIAIILFIAIANLIIYLKRMI